MRRFSWVGEWLPVRASCALVTGKLLNLRAMWLTTGLLVSLGSTLHSDESTLHSRTAVLPHMQLVGIESGGWQFAAADEQLQLVRDIVQWGSYPGICQEPAVWLSDGSWLCGRLTVSESMLTVDSHWFERVSLPLTSVRGIVFNPYPSLRVWHELHTQMLQARGGQDRLWLCDGNELAGIVSWAVADGGESRVTLETNGHVLEFRESQIQCIAFSPALLGDHDPEKPSKRIGLEDGSLLRLRDMAVDANQLRMTTQDGVELVSLDDPRQFVNAVKYIADHPAQVLFLSDLPVASYKHVGDTTLEWPLGVDRDVHGRPLIVGSGIVEKGLAMHSASQVAFRWDGSPAVFQAEIALAEPIEGASKSLGSAVCRVLLARGGKLENVFEAELRRGDNSTSIIKADLRSAQLLVLTVEPADFGQFGDHVLWLSPAIISSTD